MKYFLLLFFLTCYGYVTAQETLNKRGTEELGFISHLINSQQYEEAVYHISQLPVKDYNSVSLQDSMHFLKAWSYYCLKLLDSSAFYFQKVRERSPLYISALFFASSDFIFLGQIEKAWTILEKIPVKDSVTYQLRNLQYAGLSLLKHDYDSYSNYALKFERSHYSLSNEEIVLEDCYKSMRWHKEKSLFVAGALSAVIPGAGKFYAGKQGEGISSFLLVSFLAAITTENYIKAGPSNYKTIFFGSLFTVFYIGNIYGSVASLKVSREEFYRKYENTVQLHIHIPLRTIYAR